jgi:hypothetical protein
VIYFLSPSCVNWLFKQIGSYQQSALIFDYWPAEMAQHSQCFQRAMPTLHEMMREKVISYLEPGFWSEENLIKLIKHFNIFSYQFISETEKQFAEPSDYQLTDVNQFFPVKLYASSTLNIR